ncbi:MAG: hypothetical protein Q9170_006062 [Blastenia crenularia]
MENTPSDTAKANQKDISGNDVHSEPQTPTTVSTKPHKILLSKPDTNTLADIAEGPWRKPTKAEQAAAKTRAEEIQNDLDRAWKPRGPTRAAEAKIKKYLEISKGAFIGSKTPVTKKRGRPTGRKTRMEALYEDSEPDVDCHGYLPGEREAEDRRFARVSRLLQKANARRVTKAPVLDQYEDEAITQHVQRGASSPETSNIDTSPSPPAKKRRASRPIRKPSSKKQSRKFTPNESPYAPTKPPTRRLGRAATNPHRSPSEESDERLPSPVAKRSTRRTQARALSFFDQRMVQMERGNARSRAQYPAGFDDAPPAYTSVFDNGGKSRGSRVMDAVEDEESGYGEAHHASNENGGMEANELLGDEEEVEDAEAGAEEGL